MKCHKASKLLSAYYDGQLPEPVAEAVRQHLERCPKCRDELAAFGRLSGMARQLDDPQPPAELWRQITAGLDSPTEATRRAGAVTSPPPSGTEAVGRNPWRQAWWSWRVLAAAAAVLLAASALWLGIWAHRADRGHERMAAAFHRYVDRFATDPLGAQNILLAEYGGRKVDPARLSEQLGYRPLLADGLPSQYSLEAMYVLQMPCCTCVQAVCRRSDGKLLAVFEHARPQPSWFAGHRAITVCCKGCPCSLIEAGPVIAASWRAADRQLTVVGATDLDQVAELVAYLGGKSPEG